VRPPISPLLLALAGLLLLLPACAEGVTQGVNAVSRQAYATLNESGIVGQVVERTGISALADDTIARYRQLLTAEDVRLDTVGVPLPMLAAGFITGPQPPDLVRAALAEIAAEHGPAVARHLMIGAVTGGTTMVTSLPGFAEGAYAAQQKLAAAQAAQAEIEAAYAESEKSRPETALVPDEDRPSEAATLIKAADQPAGTKQPWHNDLTGATGSVEVGAPQPDKTTPTIICRQVRREYRRATVERTGQGTICRQGGVWYVLS
jgi:hypothetical protein